MTLAEFLMKRCGTCTTWEQAAAKLEVQVSTLRWVIETVEPRMVEYFDRKAAEARAQRRASSSVPFPDEGEPAPATRASAFPEFPAFEARP